VAREFVEFQYQTRESWSRARRVIGKAEVLQEKNNPRFIVTNLPREGFQSDAPERFAPCKCYEGFYCPRGNMENEIKQQFLDTRDWPFGSVLSMVLTVMAVGLAGLAALVGRRARV
jgi:hypothetical protein